MSLLLGMVINKIFANNMLSETVPVISMKGFIFMIKEDGHS